jgi:MYXO-CTERM domain-containing protein
MRVNVGLVCFFVSFCAASSAYAHGGQPVPRSLYVDPFDHNMQTLVSSDLGLHTSPDGGETWHWICEDIVGFDVRDFALAGSGELPASERVWLSGGVGITQGEAAGEYVDGLYLSEDGGCNWSPVGGILAGQWVGVISVDPAQPEVVVVATRHINLPNGVAYSEDSGRTWQWSNIDSEDRELKSMVRAPGNSAVLYASATQKLLRSEDGGRTWESFFEELVEEEVDELDVHMVDPEDADVLYFSVFSAVGRHLYVTRDAGLSAQKLLEPSGRDFQAVTILSTDDDGGRMILVGDAFGTGFISTDLGQSWEEFLSSVVSFDCLRGDPTVEGGLFVCSNPFVQFLQPIFALGKSADDGRNVTPYFAYGDTDDYLQCGDDSQIMEVCAALMEVGEDVGGDTGFDPFGDVGVDAGSDAGQMPADAGPGLGVGSGPGGGCGCATPTQRRPAGGLWLLALLLAGGLARRRS